MASTDWNALTGAALSTSVVAKQVSNAYLVPSGGGTFTMAMNVITAQSGFAGYSCNVAGTKPIPSGKCGIITAAIKHYAGKTTSCPVIGFMRGTDPSTASGYMVTLTTESSYKVGLFKCTPASGGFVSTAASTKLLRSSTASYTDDGNVAAAWFHLQLTAMVNPHGEVVLIVRQNALATNPVTAPVWASIAGMSSFTDDSVGKLSGSSPYVDTFYPFFGMYTSADVGGMVLIDHVTVQVQTVP